MQKPYAASCERNQQVIFQVLKKQIQAKDKNILEVGSGSGQHAVYIAEKIPKIQWHTTELLENHQGIQMWLDEAGLENIKPPLEYQAGINDLPKVDADIVFTANTLHIMSWNDVKTMIHQFGNELKPNARIIIYGPFNYSGKYTSASNASFDLWLKEQGAHRAIRDFEKVVEQMDHSDFKLINDESMPANNQMLVFKKC